MSERAPGPYVVRKRIRFAHIDAAGIVFYPRFFELFNEVVEDWFTDELGTSFAALREHDAGGVPTVRIACEFAAATRLGEELDFSLTVTALGRSSFSLEIVARHGDELRLRGQSTLVFASVIAGQPRAEPLPAELREKMERYRA